MPAGNQATQIIFLVVIVGAFYFLLIRPQQQQSKRQRAMVESLEVGTEIMTIGGIYATIVEVHDDRLRVRVADGSELEVAKRAVASVVASAENGEESEDGEGDSPAGQLSAEGAAEAPKDDAEAPKDDAADD
jgi:preprotein translocase subunit YajC